MIIFLLLLSTLWGVLIAIWFINKFQKNIFRRMSSFSASFASVRSTSPAGPSGRNIAKSLSDPRHSQDRFEKSLLSVTTLQRTLVNLRVLEYKLAELEHFLAAKALNVAPDNQSESSDNFSDCASSGDSN